MNCEKKVQLGKVENKYIYKLLCKQIKSVTETLAAEHVLLQKTDSVTPQKFKEQIEEIVSLRNYEVPLHWLNGSLIKKGNFISHDKNTAAEILFANLVDLWLYPKEDYVGETEIIAFKKDFFDRYFSRLANTASTKEAQTAVPLYHRVFIQGRLQLSKQREVLKGIICAYLKEGDNVLYYLCPITPIQEYKITTEQCTPFFSRLIERVGDNIFLKNTDITSSDFIMAFVESLNINTSENKREILMRLATILTDEGKRI